MSIPPCLNQFEWLCVLKIIVFNCLRPLQIGMLQDINMNSKKLNNSQMSHNTPLTVPKVKKHAWYEGHWYVALVVPIAQVP